jgi:hypothetical protein
VGVTEAVAVGEVNLVVRNVGPVAVTRGRPLAFLWSTFVSIVQLQKSIAPSSTGACGESLCRPVQPGWNGVASGKCVPDYASLHPAICCDRWVTRKVGNKLG